MADCECLAGCPFFFDKMEKMPAMADIYKKNYCQGDSQNCARHRVFEQFGKTGVPSDLYPNDAIRADEILGS